MSSDRLRPLIPIQGVQQLGHQLVDFLFGYLDSSVSSHLLSQVQSIFFILQNVVLGVSLLILSYLGVLCQTMSQVYKVTSCNATVDWKQSLGTGHHSVWSISIQCSYQKEKDTVGNCV